MAIEAAGGFNEPPIFPPILSNERHLEEIQKKGDKWRRRGMTPVPDHNELLPETERERRTGFSEKSGRTWTVRKWKNFYAKNSAALPEPVGESAYHQPGDVTAPINLNMRGGKSDEEERIEMEEYYKHTMSKTHIFSTRRRLGDKDNLGGTYMYRAKDVHHVEAPESNMRTIIPEPPHLARKHKAKMVDTGKLDHLKPPFAKLWVEPPVVEDPKPGWNEPPVVQDPKPGWSEPPVVQDPKPGWNEPPGVQDPKPAWIEPPVVEDPKPGEGWSEGPDEVDAADVLLSMKHGHNGPIDPVGPIGHSQEELDVAEAMLELSRGH
jgi:hypothetical protein